MSMATLAGNEGNEGKDTTTTTKSSKVNSISCSASADSTAYSSSKNAHVTAFAAAHKHACSQTNDPKWNGSIVSDWQKGAAHAVAAVSITFLKQCLFVFLHAEVTLEAVS
jgi:hypothetical protein